MNAHMKETMRQIGGDTAHTKGEGGSVCEGGGRLSHTFWRHMFPSMKESWSPLGKVQPHYGFSTVTHPPHEYTALLV